MSAVLIKDAADQGAAEAAAAVYGGCDIVHPDAPVFRVITPDNLGKGSVGAFDPVEVAAGPPEAVTLLLDRPVLPQAAIHEENRLF